jgi:PKD repeat protein
VNLAAGDVLHDLQWTFGEAGATSTLYDPYYTYLNPGLYTVKLKAFNSDNCSDSVYKEVQVVKLPEPDFTFQSTPCNNTVTFHDVSIPGFGTITSWEWKWDDTTPSLVLTPPQNGDATHSYTAEGTYQVTLIVTNSHGCIDSIVKQVSTTCITSVFTVLNSINCSSDSIEFRDLSSPVNKISNWKWDFGDLKPPLIYTTHRDTVRHQFAPGTYMVTLSTQTIVGGNTVTATNSQSVTINAAPVANFARDSVCFGDSTRFIDLTQENQVPVTYRTWKFGDNTTVTYQDTIINPVHKYLRPGVFKNWLIVRNNIGCRDSIYKQVIVHKLPVAAFTSSPPCQRYDIEFVDNSKKGDTTMMKWLWNFNDPQKPYETFNTRVALHRFDSIGAYPVYFKVTDKNGCVDDTVYSSFVVRQSPIAAFTFTDNFDGKQGNIKLNNESSADAKAFRWDLGNGKTSTDRDPVALYTYDDKVYTIELVTWNDGLCYDTTYLTYEFMFDNLFVPNAFSPTNLSGSLGCRLFQPKGLNLKDYHAMVFDKWGHLIWESNLISTDGKGSPVEGWDGTFNGELMPQDVYMWKISATFNNGKVWEGSEAGNGSTTTMGTVTLIR